ncbi:hypothetical protein BaRGS_00031280 [Batillaria attramentaria]|uniref:Uncharacterized protein n=1 Tax=Batillaria attramentaria TaxID=370345 RepID=A0ABD0JQT8_9CAEN
MVGERLASPTGVPHSESATELGNTTEHSPVSGLSIMRSASSPTLHNASLVSTVSIPNTLNQGFIDPDDTMDLDATRSTLASLVPGSPPSGHQERGRTLARTDSCRPGQKPVRRSHSTDGSLRRGQPNTLGNGLLEGKTDKLTKLRRSLDKSDIGYPIPVIVPTLPDRVSANVDQTSCKGRVGDRGGTSDNTAKHEDKAKSLHKSPVESVANYSREESVLESSLLNVVLPPPTGFNDQTMMETGSEGGSDAESDAGFSTISGGTVIHNPPTIKSSTLHSLRADFNAGPRSMANYGSSVSVNMPHPPLQPSTSVDSLLSSASELSVVSSSNSSRPLERSFSVDSGKGSLVEGVDTKAATKKRREGRQLNTTFTKTSPSEVSKVGRSEIEDYKPVNTSNGRSIKSVSAEDLKSRVKGERPTARSNSMYVASSGRHANVIPNLQICAETHKLLARAGFLEDSDLPPSVKDISLPARSPKKSRGQSFHLSRSDQKGSSFRSERSVISRESSSREDVREKEHRRTEVPEGNKKVKGTVEAVSQVLEPMKEELAEAMETRPQAEKPNQVHHQSGTSHQPTLSLKRAEMRMQKHESVAQIKESNAGHVAANVQQINSSLEHSGLDQSDASLHFPTCTTRKRGVSPIRIPTIFATTDKKADYYRSLAQKACRRLEDQKTANINTNRTDQSAARQGDKKHLQVPGTDKQFIFTDGESDLSSSLLETIDDVVTPRSQKHCTLTSRSPLQEATNTKPVTAHRAADNEGKLHQLRTAKGLTPHQVLRYGPVTGGSKRSPGKQVKRLQSPRSPRGRHSPHKYARSPEKSSHEALHLTSHPNQSLEQY